MSCPPPDTSNRDIKYACELRASYMHLMHARGSITIADPRLKAVNEALNVLNSLYISEVNRTMFGITDV